MINVIEIKAMNKEQAITRALKILEATSEQVIKVVEIKKSRSFLGLFNKEGIFQVEINKTRSKGQFDEKETLIKEEKKECIISDLTEKIQKKVEILLENMGLNLDIRIKKIGNYIYSVNLSGDDKGIVIGKKGKTLNSFEHLLNAMIKECRIEVDVEDFKEKREETLRELGKKMAEKAIFTKKTVRLNPMSAKERKIIHEIVNTYPELDTFSEGREPKRYIVIKRKK